MTTREMEEGDMAVTIAPRNGKAAPKERVLEIRPLQVTKFVMRLNGTTPLICDGFSDAAKEALALSQSGSPKDKKLPRDPEAEFQRSIYRCGDGRYGFPKLALRKSLAMAATRMSEVKGTAMLAAFLVDTPDELLPLEAGEPRMRTDHVVRVGRGNLAYRSEFWPWALTVPVKLHEPVVGLSEFIDIVNKAGIGVGIGNWRPEKKGDFGTFEVVEVIAR